MGNMILVTGATGNVGTEIVRQLLNGGKHQVRVAQRRLKNMDNLSSSPRVEAAVTFDFQQPETFADAFRGVSKLFLMRPPAIWLYLRSHYLNHLGKRLWTHTA